MNTEKEIVEIIKPFGPMILRAKVPDDLLNDLNQDCLDISNSKKEKIDWSHHLAGRIEEEYLITNTVLGLMLLLQDTYLLRRRESLK